MQRTGSFYLAIFIFFIGLIGSMNAQMHRTFPKPPEPAVSQQGTTSDAKSIRRLDTATMEREARELSALASSIPVDVEQLKKGLLPSDAIDKLKRIEKLSKQLRGQIRP